MDDLTSLVLKPVPLDEIHDPVLESKGCRLYVLRLDKIHPVISGNKLFKLYYYLRDAQASEHKTLLTFGGAYSNHLAATAEAASELGLKAIAIVRGEKPATLSHTLKFCLDRGMELSFISRKDYERKNEKDFITDLHERFGEFILIPEGGGGKQGKEGAEKIADLLQSEAFTHVCCAIGTATTFAGLCKLRGNGLKMTGFPVLKGMNDLDSRLKELLPGDELQDINIVHDYHFGGYAKSTQALYDFMNGLYTDHNIPTDFVYTAKMFYGIFDLLKKNYFPFNSKILAVHTGGLQGNLSLPKPEGQGTRDKGQVLKF